MFRSIVAATIILYASLPGGASAAPQIMGLVATAEPQPMQCADGPCSVVLEQVANGVAVRMAVLYLLAGNPAQA